RVRSKNEFGRKLNQSGRICVYDLSETYAADVAIHCCRSKELRVIESVEDFHPELQGLRFCQPQLSLQGAVKVVHSRSIEESPPGVTQLSERRNTKEHCVK